jgi:hypothetical protein
LTALCSSITIVITVGIGVVAAPLTQTGDAHCLTCKVIIPRALFEGSLQSAVHSWKTCEQSASHTGSDAVTNVDAIERWLAQWDSCFTPKGAFLRAPVAVATALAGSSSTKSSNAGGNTTAPLSAAELLKRQRQKNKETGAPSTASRATEPTKLKLYRNNGLLTEALISLGTELVHISRMDGTS